MGFRKRFVRLVLAEPVVGRGLLGVVLLFVRCFVRRSQRYGFSLMDLCLPRIC